MVSERMCAAKSAVVSFKIKCPCCEKELDVFVTPGGCIPFAKDAKKGEYHSVHVLRKGTEGWLL